MDLVGHELLIFSGFYVIAFTAHGVHTRWHKRHLLGNNAAKTHRFALLVAALTHPSLWEAAKEFAVHIIVNSGLIIGH